jgi:hypothetical protein
LENGVFHRSHYNTRGDYRRAMALFERSIELLRGDLLGERFGMPGMAAVTARTLLGYCLSVLGYKV